MNVSNQQATGIERQLGRMSPRPPTATAFFYDGVVCAPLYLLFLPLLLLGQRSVLLRTNHGDSLGFPPTSPWERGIFDALLLLLLPPRRQPGNDLLATSGHPSVWVLFVFRFSIWSRA